LGPGTDRPAGTLLAARGSVQAVYIDCPICRSVLPEAPDDFAFRPFCSQRCKLVDLGNWLGEKYRISRPLGPEEPSDDEFELN
jgi:uncharacterized protein